MDDGKEEFSPDVDEVSEAEKKRWKNERKVSVKGNFIRFNLLIFFLFWRSSPFPPLDSELSDQSYFMGLKNRDLTSWLEGRRLRYYFSHL